jgi:hypothetical protein
LRSLADTASELFDAMEAAWFDRFAALRWRAI